MSMTQIAFLRKAELPTNKQIQDFIQNLGYDFSILEDHENQISDDGLSCTIKGFETYLEVYLEESTDLTNQNDWIQDDLTNQDTAISFIWGADFAAGACVGLISIALIDLANALVYYIDDQMRYTREMLLADMPQYLEELKNQGNTNHNTKRPVDIELKTQLKIGFWARLISKFK